MSKMKYERPESIAVAVGDSLMTDVIIGVSGTTETGKPSGDGEAKAPRYWDDEDEE